VSAPHTGQVRAPTNTCFETPQGQVFSGFVDDMWPCESLARERDIHPGNIVFIFKFCQQSIYLHAVRSPPVHSYLWHRKLERESNMSNMSNMRARETSESKMRESETSNVRSFVPLPRARVAHEWVVHDSESGERIGEGLWSERTRMYWQSSGKILATTICEGRISIDRHNIMLYSELKHTTKKILKNHQNFTAM